jgi:hypothetical protein
MLPMLNAVDTGRRMIPMKLFTAALVTFSGLTVALVVSSVHAQQSGSFTGTVQRVWEDGFRLNTGDRTLRVDTWDLCGDFTTRYVGVGDRLTVTGEFDGGDFDAFSISASDGVVVCRQENYSRNDRS